MIKDNIREISKLAEAFKIIAEENNANRVSITIDTDGYMNADFYIGANVTSLTRVEGQNGYIITNREKVEV